jgi:SAM-dependent methyltransferase
MPDPIFQERRLAEIYDLLDPVRNDLEAYVALVDELSATTVLDIGCGTGTFACLLAQRGKAVTGVDPAHASLDVARTKPGADKVQWLTGDATTLPPMQVDIVTMTGNVAQVFLSDEGWVETLRACCAAVPPRGLLVFEVRDPARKGWLEWTRDQSHRRVELPGGRFVEHWVELTEVSPPFVTFRWTFLFDPDGTVLTSVSTLRFRSEIELVGSLEDAGFGVREVRDAPDRPGREFVFIAQRQSE